MSNTICDYLLSAMIIFAVCSNAIGKEPSHEDATRILSKFRFKFLSDSEAYLDEEWSGSDDDLRLLGELKGITSIWINTPKVSAAAFTHFEKLSDLTRITARHVPLSDESLASLEKCAKLESVIINCKYVTDMGIQSLRRCKELKRVMLLNAWHITAEGTRTFASHPKLEYFYINKATINAKALTWCRKSSKLESLEIDSCVLLVDALKPLNGCHQIQWLKLSACFGDGVSLDCTANMAGLIQITAIGVRIPGEDIAAVAKCTSLQRLIMKGVILQDNDIRPLAGHKSLEAMCVADSALTDRSLQYLGKIPSLKKLNLNGNRINGSELSCLGDLSGLHDLQLADCPVRAPYLKSLSKLKKLNTLSLRNTPASDATVEIIRALPILGTVDLRGTNITKESVSKLEFNSVGVPIVVVLSDEDDGTELFELEYVPCS